MPNADPSWLTEKAWVEVLNLSQLHSFSGFAEHMASHMPTYRAIFDRLVGHVTVGHEPNVVLSLLLHVTTCHMP